MSGLGIGGYVAGPWADRRYAARPQSLLATYGYLELGIGVLGFVVSMLLPRLGAVSAAISSYTQDARGWYVLSTGSYLARYAIAVVMLAPITLLMGGTLTVLIRHVVRRGGADRRRHRALRLRRDGHRDRLVPTHQRARGKSQIGAVAGAHNDPRRHLDRLHRRRIPARAVRAPGAPLHDRAGSVRDLHAGGPGHGRRQPRPGRAGRRLSRVSRDLGVAARCAGAVARRAAAAA